MSYFELASKISLLEPCLSELPYAIPAHRKLLYIYRTRAERTSALLRATLTSIEQKEAVVPFADERFLSLLRRTAEATGREATDNLHPVDHVDPSKGLGPDHLIELIRLALDQAGGEESRRARLLVDTQLAYTLAGTEEDFLGFTGKLAELTEDANVSLIQVCFYEFLPRHTLAEFLTMHTDVILSPALGSLAHQEERHTSSTGLISAIRALYLSRAAILRRVLDPVMTRGEKSEALRLPEVTDHLRQEFVLLDSDLAVRYASTRAAVGRDGLTLGDVLSPSDYPRVRATLEIMGGWNENPLKITLSGNGRRDSRFLCVHRLDFDGELVGYLCIFQSVSTEGNGSVSADRRGGGDSKVTEREHEIVRLLLGGLRNREIAEKLNVAEITVKKHLGSVYRKLHVRNRIELMRLWDRTGTRT